MADLSRFSVGSLDSDQFYSAPSSRHVSVHASPRKKREQPEADHKHAEDAVHNAPPDPPRLSTSKLNGSPPAETTRSKWALASALRHQHEPKHHQFCPKPAIQRWRRTNGVRRAGSAGDGQEGQQEYILVADNAVSSPAPPVTTKRWSSTCIGSHGLLTPHPNRLSVELDHQLDDPAIARQGIEGIVSNIRAYLSHRRHENCAPQPNSVPESDENSPNSSGSRRKSRKAQLSESFLVTTNDIAGILDIVIAGLRSLHDENLSSGCLTLLLPRDLVSKPNPNATAVVPRTSSLADPATTISSVRPSFSLVGSKYSQNHYEQSPRTTKATIISRQSVTEVNWDSSSDKSSKASSPVDGSAPNVLRDISRIPSNSSSPHISSTPRSPNLTRRASAIFGHGHGEPNPFAPQQVRRPSSQPAQELPGKKRCRTKTPTSAPDESHIVSFPALRSRTCTNDWIFPSGEDDGPEIEQGNASSALYQCGVDAHCGAILELPVEAPPSGEVLPVAATMITDDRSGTPWSCEGLAVGERLEKKMGKAIGSSSHRRKSSARHLEQSAAESGDTILNKLRRYSFLPLIDQIPENIRQATPPLQVRDKLPLRKERNVSSRELLEEILAKSPSSPRPSRSSHVSVGNMSRKMSKRSVTRERVSCSEDQHPHVCTDEQMTPTPMSDRTLDELYT